MTKQISVHFLPQGKVHIQVFRFNSSKHYFVQSSEQRNTTKTGKQCKSSPNINIHTKTGEPGRNQHNSQRKEVKKMEKKMTSERVLNSEVLNFTTP